MFSGMLLLLYFYSLIGQVTLSAMRGAPQTKCIIIIIIINHCQTLTVMTIACIRKVAMVT